LNGQAFKEELVMKKFSLGVLTGLLIGLLAFATFAVADSPIKLIVNGAEVACDTPPQIIDNHVMVPISTVSTALNASATWDATSNTVTITSNAPATTTTTGLSGGTTIEVTGNTDQVITIPATGSTTPKTTTNVDGSTTTINSDGSTTITTANGGASTTTNADGSKTWSGRYREEKDSNGHTTLVPDPDGNVGAGGGQGGPSVTQKGQSTIITPTYHTHE